MAVELERRLVGDDISPALATLGVAASVIPRALYLGQAANGCFIPSQLTPSQTKQMSRVPHFARDTLVNPRLIIPNFRTSVTGFAGDVGIGAPSVNTASFEWQGVPYQAKLNGNPSMPCPDFDFIVTDPITKADGSDLIIPRGSLVFDRIYRTCSAGIIFNQMISGNILTPDMSFVFSGGSATDLTMATGPVFSPTANVFNTGFAAAGILSMTNRLSWANFGDSRDFGAADTKSLKDVDIGNIERSIGPDYATMNLSISSETLRGFIASSSIRRRLAAYCSHQILQLGVNDLPDGAPTVATRFAQALALLDQTKPVVTTTMEPYLVTSTDNFVTTVNQALGATNADRITENNRRRALPAGISACWEITDDIETNVSGAITRDGGYWGCQTPVGAIGASGLATTADGTHRNPLGNRIIRDSGRVQPKAFGL